VTCPVFFILALTCPIREAKARGREVVFEDVSLTEKYIFAHIRGVIIASKLSKDEKNEILDRLRDLPCLDGPQSEDQKCDPVLWQT
jgi:hypothetical protein